LPRKPRNVRQELRRRRTFYDESSGSVWQEVAGAVVAGAAGVPPVALVGEAIDFVKGLGTGKTGKDAVGTVTDAGEKVGKAAEGGFLDPKQASSLPGYPRSARIL
jgi:hypothetical protein